MDLTDLTLLQREFCNRVESSDGHWQASTRKTRCAAVRAWQTSRASRTD